MTHEAAAPPGTIHSEPHGPHWVAWVADAAGRPERSIVLVGLTKEEAEERAKRWLEEQIRPPR